jgi:hypothetical protein
MQSYFRQRTWSKNVYCEKNYMKKIRFVYLRKTWLKFYQNPDPHSSKMLDPDPDPLIINADPKHWLKCYWNSVDL